MAIFGGGDGSGQNVDDRRVFHRVGRLAATPSPLFPGAITRGEAAREWHA